MAKLDISARIDAKLQELLERRLNALLGSGSATAKPSATSGSSGWTASRRRKQAAEAKKRMAAYWKSPAGMARRKKASS